MFRDVPCSWFYRRPLRWHASGEHTMPVNFISESLLPAGDLLQCVWFYTMAAAKKLSNADLALKQKFIQWFAKNAQRELNILITGKTGVGKSRLVNALVGQNVAKEGREKRPCTTDISPYSISVNGIKVVVWDSPGLQDGTGNDELYLANLKDKLKHGVDIMIYCIKMDDKRFHSEDKMAVRLLTASFGTDLWKKSVIALTFANKIEDPDEEDELAYFMGDLYFWQKGIDNYLDTELGIASRVRNSIPITPCGNYKKLRLPSCDHWLADLWSKCDSVMDHSSGLAWYEINKNRVKFSCSAEMAAACSSSSMGAQGELSSSFKSESSPDTDESEDIPKEIPLNDKQEISFLKKMWEAFVLSGAATLATAVTFTVLKVLFRR